MKTETATSPKKIIVLGHDASQSGAPIFLLHLARWLKQRGGVELEIILRNDGPLEEEFRQIAPVKILQFNRLEMALHRLCGWLQFPTPAWISLPAKITRHLRGRNVDLVYANTVAVADEAAAAARLGLPVLWQIHELPYCINAIEGGHAFRRANHLAHGFAAVSEGVKRGLVAANGVPAEKIQVIHGFVPPEKNGALDVPASRSAVRQELNLSSDAFVAGMCGSVCWHKGVDWFLAVARELAAEFADREIHLLWIGAAESELLLSQVNHDLRLARLTERVQFIGVKPDSRPYLAALDAFLLSSREDSFPLVMLEAASLGLPVVCFADSGGGPEFVGTDAGIVVDYADTRAAAQALVKLSESPELRRTLGTAGRQKVLSGHTIEIQAPKILRLMEQLCGRTTGNGK